MNTSLIVSRESFVYPTKEEVIKIKAQYPELSKVRIEELDKSLLPSFPNTWNVNEEVTWYNRFIKTDLPVLDLLEGVNPAYELTVNFLNKVRLTKHYLYNLLCLSKRPLNKFEVNDGKAANTILYENNYEMFYVQISNTRDRWYQLVNVYYNLGIPISSIIKTKIAKELKERYSLEQLNKEWDELCKNDLINKSITIRNKFTHRISPFEESVIFDKQKQCFIDDFKYEDMTKIAKENYLNYIEFIEKYAIPFLNKSLEVRGKQEVLQTK